MINDSRMMIFLIADWFLLIARLLKINEQNVRLENLVILFHNLSYKRTNLTSKIVCYLMNLVNAYAKVLRGVLRLCLLTDCGSSIKYIITILIIIIAK